MRVTGDDTYFEVAETPRSDRSWLLEDSRFGEIYGLL
jgi:hypothetical protein